MRFRGRECLRFKREGSYQSLTWADLDEKILNLAGSLLQLGLQKGDRIALLSENRPEWAIADFAILAIGGITVPIYLTLTPIEKERLLQDSGAKCLLVSSPPLSKTIPNWRGITLSLEEPTFSEILQEGENFRRKEGVLFSARLQGVTQKDIATIIYTSGTTGDPKGVMLSHENFLSNCHSCSNVIPITEKDIYLSFLPLSHIFERMAGFYFILFQGGCIAYAENMETVFQNMQEVQPTVVSGVPRFFEKLHDAIIASVMKRTPFKRALFFWAFKIGREEARSLHFHTALPLRAILQYPLASLLVLKPLRRKLGRSLRFFISGGAPLSVEIIEFFAAFHCTILEGYGLTETSPVISVNRLDRRRWGSVGLPIPGVEVKIAPDGEILVRGPNVMQGYFHREQETKEVFREGYFLTGDIGTLDSGGFLTITDRKKDLIKTSGGKFVSPQKIETLLKQDPWIDEAVVFGDKHKYIVALLIPNFPNLEKVLLEKHLDVKDRETLLSHPEIVSFFAKRVDTCLKDLASFEKVKKFALLEKELSQIEGELTPTLKVKRKRLYEKHRDLIESLYQEAPESEIDKLHNF